MLKQYPNYRRGELLVIRKKLPGKEKKELIEYENYCRMNASQGKVDDMLRNIVQFRDICEKPCSDLKMLRDFLTLLNQSDRKKWTKNGIKIHIKHFLRWKYKDWSLRFDNFRDIKLTNGFNGERINEGTLIDKEDIEKMVKAEPRLYWKAFLITLYEAGLRPIELINLKRKDIEFNIDGDISMLHIFATKTDRARTVYVKQATFYLKRLAEETKGELLFHAVKNPNAPINKQTLSMWLRRLSKKVLGREIFPYILRHSRANELYKSMPSKVAQKFMGHGKDMTDFYTHFSSEDVKEALGKTVYNFEDMPEEKKHDLELKVDRLQKELDTMREFFILSYAGKGKISDDKRKAFIDRIQKAQQDK